MPQELMQVFTYVLDSAILKLLKKGSREQWIFKFQKIRRNQYITPISLFYKNWGFDLEGVLL